MNKQYMEFPISIYGNVEKVNDVLSKARCRIFYKGANRNGTFITDNFAEQLVSTLAYVPVKGIYKDGDYSDHGESRTEGQIYGIVPESNNFAWESHLDEDGVERTYACSDVYLFTALYPEASEIIGKGQSMELYEPSLVYHWSILQDQKYVVFERGRFLGLQVLGDDVEPCFEGASFFSLQSTIQDAIQKIKEYSTGGQSEMPKVNFKLSDNQKYSYLWDLLNPNFNEEGDWTISCAICDVFDDYVLTFNYDTGCYERVYYTKNDESDSIELGEVIPVFVIDVTENEKKTLDALRQLNGGSYELVNENLEKAEENAEKCIEFSSKIDEMNETITTLNTEVENVQGQLSELNEKYTAAEAQNSTISEELNSLRNYKQANELRLKEAVVAEYTDKLSEEVLDAYKVKFDEYSVEELDMHLAYELKKMGSSVFTQVPKGTFLPKDTPRTGVEEILSRYKK